MFVKWKYRKVSQNIFKKIPRFRMIDGVLPFFSSLYIVYEKQAKKKKKTIRRSSVLCQLSTFIFMMYFNQIYIY